MSPHPVPIRTARSPSSVSGTCARLATYDCIVRSPSPHVCFAANVLSPSNEKTPPPELFRAESPSGPPKLPLPLTSTALVRFLYPRNQIADTFPSLAPKQSPHSVSPNLHAGMGLDLLGAPSQDTKDPFVPASPSNMILEGRQARSHSPVSPKVMVPAATGADLFIPYVVCIVSTYWPRPRLSDLLQALPIRGKDAPLAKSNCQPRPPATSSQRRTSARKTAYGTQAHCKAWPST